MKIKKMILICSFLSILAGPSAFANDVSCEVSTDEHGYTNLMWFSWEGNIKEVQCLIDAGSKVNAIDNNGWTALMSASAKGHEKVAKLLIEKKADVHAANFDGWTVLMAASEWGHIGTVKLLLEKRVDVHAKNKKGDTALMIAEESMIRRGSYNPNLHKRLEEVVRILKEEEAKN